MVMCELIYIVGSGRSGSTLLEIILGSQEDVFSCGELCQLIIEYLNGSYCACGETLSNCNYWSNIVTNWIKKNHLTLNEIRRFAYLDYFYSHPKNLKAWFMALISFYQTEEYKWYLALLKSLLLEIVQHTQAKIITDSSKSPVRILNLKKIWPGKITIIHLIRSPFEIISSLKKSWTKDKKKGIQNDIPARNPIRTAIFWIVINSMAEFVIWLTKIKCLRIKYEDLIKNPYILSRIYPNIKLKEPFPGTHICAGNRIRMKKNIKIIQNKPQKCKENLIIKALLYFFLRKYGYK